jgi:hypothetical protein
MKGLILGVAGLGAVGGVAFVGGGKPPVDDYVGIVNRPPAEVYAALAAIGPEGVQTMPTVPGAPRVAQKISREANKSVRVEVTLDDATLGSIEFQLQPADGGKTQLAAEVDLDTAVLSDAMRRAGGPGLPLPGGGMSESLLDRGFAIVMEQAVKQVNDGTLPLSGLAQAGRGWSGGPGGRGSSATMAAAPTWNSGSAARPQASARPAVDPNRAVRDHIARQNEVQGSGW